jgi:cell division protein FtsN
MSSNKFVPVLCCVLALSLFGCSRQQSDWQKARETNTAEAYEQFLKKYPSGEFTAQAQARVKELYEERDWQKARDADTPEAYQAFLRQYPEGKWTEEARIRLENFTLGQTPSAETKGSGNAPAGTNPQPGASQSTASQPGASQPAAPSPAGPAKPTSQSAASRAAAHEAAHGSKSSERYGVQLGAFKSGADAANRRWTHLQKQYPKLLAGLSSKVVPKKSTKGTLYRLQAFGVTETHARDICKSLKSKSQPCVVIRPAQA